MNQNAKKNNGSDNRPNSTDFPPGTKVFFWAPISDDVPQFWTKDGDVYRVSNSSELAVFIKAATDRMAIQIQRESQEVQQ